MLEELCNPQQAIFLARLPKFEVGTCRKVQLTQLQLGFSALAVITWPSDVP